MTKLTKHISELATEVRPLVQQVLATPATTQDYYGNWLGILLQAGEGQKLLTGVVALALIEAGAPRRGVLAALRLTGLA